MNFKAGLSFSAAFLLAGCSNIPCLNNLCKSSSTPEPAQQVVHYAPQGPVQYVAQNTQYVADAYVPVRLSAIGYGAASSAEGHTPGQRRLLAMRASKLDAYRSLAEQVYGIRLTSNTTISALMSQNDGFRAYIDAYLRGARIVSVTPMADGNYETTIEIDFDDRAARSYLPASPQQNMQPAGRSYVAQQAPVYVAPPAATAAVPVYAAQPVGAQRRVVDDGIRGTAGPGRSYGTSFYYAE